VFFNYNLNQRLPGTVTKALSTLYSNFLKPLLSVMGIFIRFDSVLTVKTHYFSVVDRHRVDADLDPDRNFHVDADPYADADPDWQLHQNNVDPRADPTPSFTHVGKPKFFIL
jgi:hypothetical protein